MESNILVNILPYVLLILGILLPLIGAYKLFEAFREMGQETPPPEGRSRHPGWLFASLLVATCLGLIVPEYLPAELYRQLSDFKYSATITAFVIFALVFLARRDISKGLFWFGLNTAMVLLVAGTVTRFHRESPEDREKVRAASRAQAASVYTAQAPDSDAEIQALARSMIRSESDPLTLAQASLVLGEWEESVAYLAEAEKRREQEVRDQAEVFLLKGNALYYSGDLEGASRAYAMSLQIDPQESDVWKVRAGVLRELGHAKAADNAEIVAKNLHSGMPAEIPHKADNTPPTARIGSHQKYLEVTFQDRSSDIEGPIAAREWDLGDGSEIVDEPNPFHTYSTPGTYRVKLTVTDKDGASSQAEKELVLEENQPPEASFDNSHDYLNVYFRDLSSDHEDAIVSWHWDFGNEDESTSKSPKYVYDTPGDYFIKLRVEDDGGLIDEFGKSVSVVGNKAPEAMFRESVDGLRVFLENESRDEDGHIVSWQWNLEGEVVGEKRNLFRAFENPGTYNIELTVIDDGGARDTYSREVAVPGHAVPEIDFSYRSFGLTAILVDNTELESGFIVRRDWVFDDDERDTGKYVQRTFDAPGEYGFTLEVTDDSGGRAVRRGRIRISDYEVPRAKFSATSNYLTVFFKDESEAHDGYIVSRLWNFGQAEETNVKNPRHTYEEPGKYMVSLTVMDNHDKSHTYSAEIEVKANVRPEADFEFTTEGMEASFVDASSDHEWQLRSWRWRFGDGDESFERSPTHVYERAGDYDVTLEVLDDDGLSHAYRSTVSIREPQPSAQEEVAELLPEDSYREVLKAVDVPEGSVERKPIIRKTKKIEYPGRARKLGRTGSVKIDAFIRANGRIEIDRSDVSRDPFLFRKAVIAAMEQWEYTAGIANGEPCDFRYTLSVAFRLED